MNKKNTLFFAVIISLVLIALAAEFRTRNLPLKIETHLDPQSVDAQFAKAAPAYKRFARLLDTNGDGTGTKLATGDYSSSTTSFKICPPANKVFRISVFHAHYQDTPGWKAGEYGAGVTVSNGVRLMVTAAGAAIDGMDFTEALPFTNNSTWGRLFTMVEFVTIGGGDEFANLHWDIGQSGLAIRLEGNKQHCLAAVLSDDFSFLVAQHFTVEGHIVGETY